MAPAGGRRVALTGVRSFPGAPLLSRLEGSEVWDEVLTFDILPPPPSTRGPHVKVDLTNLESDRVMAEALREHRVDTFVHLAYLSYPTHDASWGHELEAIGTIRVLDACAEAGIAHFITVSTTAVYGAAPSNPAFLTENAPLKGKSPISWINDKVDAEREIERFRERHPQVSVTVLRPCTVLGPLVTSYMARLLSRPVVPTVMGYDPLFQFLHQDDLLNLLEAVVANPEEGGVYNVVPEGVIHLSTALKLIRRFPLALPHLWAYPLFDVLWMAQLVEMPGSFLDYFRYGWVADGAKARDRLAFRPLYSTRQTLLQHDGPKP